MRRLGIKQIERPDRLRGGVKGIVARMPKRPIRILERAEVSHPLIAGGAVGG